VESAPRAYKLKASNAAPPISTITGTCPSYVLPIHAIVHFDGLVHRREHDQSSIDQNRAPIAICFDCFHLVGDDNQIRIFAPADESLRASSLKACISYHGNFIDQIAIEFNRHG
jgi:hypothetical protein